MRALVRGCGALGVAALVGGYLGALHPVGDSLAVFRLWIAVAVLGAGAVLLALRDRWAGIYFVGLAAVAGFGPALALAGPGEPVAGLERPYAIYQKNLLYAARDTAAILAEIGALAPDFITLQEVAAANRDEIFDRLPEEYERRICQFAAVGAVALAARHPIREGSFLCIEGLGLVAAQVEVPGEGAVWLVSIHLHWPWPRSQPEQVSQILPLLARMEGPVLIGGDFNMVRWSHVMAEMAQASRSRPVAQGRATFELRPGLGLEIDHILLPRGREAAVERLEFLGSDHRGLIARFGF